MCKQPAQIVVDPFHAPQKLSQVRVVGEPFVLFVREVFRVVTFREFVGIHVRQVEQIGTPRVAGADGSADVRNQFVVRSPGGHRTEFVTPFPQRIGSGDVHSRKVRFIPRGVVEVIVRGFVVVHQEERLVFIPSFFQPVERQVGDRIGDMHIIELDQILAPRLVAADTEFRVVVFPLPREHAVVVEVGRFNLEVPFADHRGLIAGFFHLNGEHLIARLHLATQIERAVRVVVLTGQHAGAGGRTDGVGAEGVREQRPFVGQPVDVRRGSDFSQTAAVRGNSVSGVIIGHDVQNVGPVGSARQAGKQ